MSSWRYPHVCIICAQTLHLYNMGKLLNLLLSVCVWLQEKRSAFPRFYFIGDDDLLEILGQATNPTVIQSHLKKLFAGQKPLFSSFPFSYAALFFVLLSFALLSSLFFVSFVAYHSTFCWIVKAMCVCLICAGIHSVVFDEQCQHIVAMCSLEGEIVPLRNLIRISSLVEVDILCRVLYECTD